MIQKRSFSHAVLLILILNTSFGCANLKSRSELQRQNEVRKSEPTLEELTEGQTKEDDPEEDSDSKNDDGASFDSSSQTAALARLEAEPRDLNRTEYKPVPAAVVKSSDPSEERGEALKVSKSIHTIPVEMNAQVQKWIHYFSKRDRERFQRFLDRGAGYREVVENVLRENDLPAELYYLAMIESGYQNHATSTASAVGVWQFIRGTGHRYGLTINSMIDERRDPIRATEAAVRYLRDLHNVFGSWHLAMSGYNAGEYRIVRGVFKAKSRDFWTLVKLKALPAETRDYVPKFLAAVEIGNNPLKYGFSKPSGKSYPDLQALRVPGGMMLNDVARLSGVPSESLRQVNPHLLRGATPSSSKGYEIWVPQRHVAQVKRASRSMEQFASRTGGGPRFVAREVSGSKTESSSKRAKGTRVHVVRRGENLSQIASKYGVSVSDLKKSNGLSGSQVNVGKRLKVVSKVSGKSKRISKYRVKRGDNLTQIAGQFGLSVQELKKMNSMRNSKIVPGQVLVVQM